MGIQSIQDTVRLSNGVEMPCVGLGVWKAGGEDVVQAVQWAIQAGYRHVDTAEKYENEAEVAQGIRRAGIDRKQLFITSKLAEHGAENAIAHCEQSLRRLNTDYLDLYLIHWPMPWLDRYVETWQGLETLYRQGKVRAIGVSNFAQEHLDTLLAQCDIAPMVNQFEHHPYYQTPELLDYCRQHGIQFEAYSPLANGAVFEDAALRALAEAYGKSVSQIILRAMLQDGIVVIPKSIHRERIEQNAQLYDFSLSEADMRTLYAMDRDEKMATPRPDQTFEEFFRLKREREAQNA